MIMQQNEKERKRSFDAIIIRRKKASDTLIIGKLGRRWTCDQLTLY